jgi:Ca2+-binding EF-hand superfamily protein
MNRGDARSEIIATIKVHGATVLRNVVLTLVGLSVSVSAGRAHADPPRRIARSAPMPELGRVAQEPKVAYGVLVDAADTDGDERVTATELESFVLRQVEKQVESRFRRLDRNRDGLVRHAEVPKMDKERFARFDLNRDDSLSMAELERVLDRQALSRCHSVFARLDLDRDGVISSADRERAEELRVSKLER